LKADAKTVDLRSLAGHYYELAAMVLEMFEEEEIVDLLCEVCHISVDYRVFTSTGTKGGSDDHIWVDVQD
jgi:hypothetical protein